MKKYLLLFILTLSVNSQAHFFKSKAQKAQRADTNPQMLYLDDHEMSPHYPIKVKVSSPNLKVNVDQLNSQYLTSLNEEEQKKFIKNISTNQVFVEWVDNSGEENNFKSKKYHPPKKVNAASALVLELMSENQPDLASTVISQTGPMTTSVFRKSKASIIFDPHLTAQTVLKIIENIKDENLVEQIKSATSCVFTYINYWSRGAPQKHIKALNSLIEKVNQLKNPTNLDTRQKGILLGAILSGTLNYSNTLKKKDEKRIYIVNSVTNLIWASTTLLGALPVGGNIIALVGGGISVAVVGYDVFYNGIGVRDYCGSIKEIEGLIEVNVLEQVTKSAPEQKIEALMMLKWLQTTIHLDGLSD